MKLHLLALSVSLCCGGSILAQEGGWTLEKCIQHALDNNLQIQQSELNAESAKSSATQSKFDLLPTINAGATHGYNWGQTIDPFTNQFATNRVRSNSLSVSSSVTLFSGFSKLNTVKQRQFDFLAAQYDAEAMQNDISMQIATNFLQVLFNKELLKVANNQYELTTLQVARIKKMVEVGQMPKSNLLDLEAQLANEELNKVNAENQLNISLLSLKQLLQINDNNFEVTTPDLSPNNLDQMAVNPEEVYKKALELRPEIKSSEYQLKSAERAKAIAIGGQSPRLSVSGSYGSGYSGNNKVPVGNPTIEQEVIGVTEISGEQVIAPNFIFDEFEPRSFKDQLDANINQSLTFQLSIPIFNGWSTRNNITRAKISYETANLRLEQSKQQLEQDIQRAHNDALAALKQYQASKKAVSALEESFKYASARYESQLINTIDYTDAKNKLTQAQSDLLRAKFDYIFKSKILDFYQGKPLAL